MRQRPIIQGMQQPIWHFGTLYVVSGYVICREHSSFLRVLEVFWLTMACSPEHPVKILTMNLCFEIFEYIVRSERYFLPDTNIYIPTTWLWPHVCLSPLSEFQSRSTLCDKFVSDLVFSEYSDFLHQLHWPPRYSCNIVESGVKHYNPTLESVPITTNVYRLTQLLNNIKFRWISY
jgi:hypothetical protein